MSRPAVDDRTAAPAAIEIVARRTIEARVAAVYAALGDDFPTRPVEALSLTFEGIEGDVHSGFTRRSGGREPWYRRRTEMRNERQLSIVAADELAEIARRMGIAEIRPEWIGANLVIEGIPRLSMLPAGTLFFFAGGATVKIDGQNAPCRLSGRSIAENAGMTDIGSGSMLFPKVGQRLRGLVGWVEKPGTITAGEAISVRIPEQWIYRA